jgi:hypothetical protein
VTWLLSLLSGPLLGRLVDAYKARLDAGNDRERIAADLAGRELAVQNRQEELHAQLRLAQLGRWYEPEKLMGYAVAIYFGKLLVWDKALALGSTDPLSGFAETTASLIVAAHFGKRTVESAIRIWKGR